MKLFIIVVTVLVRIFLKVTSEYNYSKSKFYILLLITGKGIRQLKSKGSNKINAYCPASIQLEKNNNGNCNILFIETHIGHEAEVERIQLSDSERKDLAIKIEAGIPYDKIIDEVKQSADPVDIKRIHLLTKKDLHNIQICLKRHSTAITKTNSTNENINLEENSGTPNFIGKTLNKYLERSFP